MEREAKSRDCCLNLIVVINIILKNIFVDVYTTYFSFSYYYYY